MVPYFVYENEMEDLMAFARAKLKMKGPIAFLLVFKNGDGTMDVFCNGSRVQTAKKTAPLGPGSRPWWEATRGR